MIEKTIVVKETLPATTVTTNDNIASTNAEGDDMNIMRTIHQHHENKTEFLLGDDGDDTITSPLRERKSSEIFT